MLNPTRIAACLGALSLAACGQAGPLYLPSDVPPPPVRSAPAPGASSAGAAAAHPAADRPVASPSSS